MFRLYARFLNWRYSVGRKLWRLVYPGVDMKR